MQLCHQRLYCQLGELVAQILPAVDCHLLQGDKTVGGKLRAGCQHASLKLCTSTGSL